MKRFFLTHILLLVFATITLGASSASAKNLANRLGIGYKDQFSESIPAITVQYYPSPEFGLSAVLGVDTRRDNSNFGFMVKALRVIFPEDNLNYYMGAGGGLLSRERSSVSESGFEIIGFAGVEFFFAGLENLGFSMETGISVTSLSNGVRFRTIGDSPVKAGITFYF